MTFGERRVAMGYAKGPYMEKQFVYEYTNMTKEYARSFFVILLLTFRMHNHKSIEARKAMWLKRTISANVIEELVKRDLWALYQDAPKLIAYEEVGDAGVTISFEHPQATWTFTQFHEIPGGSKGSVMITLIAPKAHIDRFETIMDTSIEHSWGMTKVTE